MKQVLSILAVLLLGSGSAQAESWGTITANWQGRAHTWFVTAQDGESQSSHDDSARVVDVISLWGNPQETDLAATKDAVSLSFMVMKGPKGQQAQGGEFYYLVSGFADKWEAAEGATDVALDVFEKSDTALHVKGTFRARPEKAGEAAEIDGAFDVTFPLE